MLEVERFEKILEYLREKKTAPVSVLAKRIISEKASRYIAEGQTVFLDASSTAQYLIKYFEGFQNLTIITNGMKTAQELNSLSHRIYCTGGLLLHNSSAYVGDFAADFVRNFNADIMFFSSRGVSEDGHITDASQEENYIRQVMLQQSRKHIFLCDHNKIGQIYCYNLCSISQVDDYITDL